MTHKREKQGKPYWKTYLANREELMPYLPFLKKEDRDEAIEHVTRTIVAQVDAWTEELIAIRTIQSLSVLDIENYREHIGKLGDYLESPGLLGRSNQ